jgi:hypothetical protein
VRSARPTARLLACLALAAVLPAAGHAQDAGVEATAEDGGPEQPPEPIAPPPKGPPPAASLECAPEQVKLGEHLVCTLTITHRADVSVGKPTSALTEDGGVELRNATHPARPTQTPEGALQSVHTYAFARYAPGPLVVPEFTAVWRETTGGEATLKVPGVTVPTVLVTADRTDADFRTFANPEGIAADGVANEPNAAAADGFWARHGPTPYMTTHWPSLIATVVLVGGALGFAIAWLVRRWIESRPQPEVEWVDPRPAHVIAFEALEQLAAEDLPGQGEVKLYYTRLSEIIREYLERRYHINAPEMTSDEIRAALRAGRLQTSAQGGAAIEAFLTESDLVKFAGFSPESSVVDSVMRAARGIVELTRAPDAPAPVPEPAPEAAT